MCIHTYVHPSCDAKPPARQSRTPCEAKLDPDYQLNPSGLMLWIAGALWLFQGGRGGVLDAWVSRAGFDGQLSAWRAERASRKDVPIWPEDGSTRRS